MQFQKVSLNHNNLRTFMVNNMKFVSSSSLDWLIWSIMTWYIWYQMFIPTQTRLTWFEVLFQVVTLKHRYLSSFIVKYIKSVSGSCLDCLIWPIMIHVNCRNSEYDLKCLPFINRFWQVSYKYRWYSCMAGVWLVQ